jgi:hypothetical protein
MATPPPALRDNGKKRQLRYNLTFRGAMEGRAAVSEYGARKYALFNYLRGAPLSQYTDCLLRHLAAWHDGEDIDPESGLPHTDHIAWNADALAHFSRYPNANSVDDRPCKIMAAQEAADDVADAQRAIAEAGR